MEDVKCRQLNKTELKGMVEVAWTLHCSEQSVIDSKKATALLERVKDKASADQLNMITVQKNVDRVEKAKFSITQCPKKNKRSQSRPGAKAIKRQKQGI